MKTMKSTSQKITKYLPHIGLSAFVASFVYQTSAYANNAASQIIGGSDKTGQQGGVTLDQGVETVVNLLLFLIGIIAVIAIIIGGIRYTTSNGDAGQTKAAKDTILNAVIGLIVAIMAYAIVRWVVGVFI